MKFFYYARSDLCCNLVRLNWFYFFQNIFTQINRKLNLIPLYTTPFYFSNINVLHNNHHADRFALGTNRDERELTNGRLSCKIKFEEEAYYNAR